jgi:hypothetical protein
MNSRGCRGRILVEENDTPPGACQVAFTGAAEFHEAAG